tara:strand:+ start:27465 stop:28277 length:813 start_codon:yes stop_codon:yes gene_type:complete
MDSSLLQFDMMAKETLELSLNLDSSMFDEQEQMAEFRPSGRGFRPQGPGILYRVVTGGSTFSLRGFACDNIKESAEELESGDASLRSTLKIEDDEEVQIHHFRCDFIEQAEVVIDQLFNRRFPLYEDMLCNLSDPGYSWWMEPNEDSLTVYFKAHSIEREKNLIKLGPIGDYALAHRRFSELRSTVRGMFSVREFSCDERRMVIKPVDANNDGFKALRNIFSKGKAANDLAGFGANELGRTLFFYLNELASVRAFWCELAPKLEKKTNLS